jgi:hypothetical protein
MPKKNAARYRDEHGRFISKAAAAALEAVKLSDDIPPLPLPHPEPLPSLESTSTRATLVESYLETAAGPVAFESSPRLLSPQSSLSVTGSFLITSRSETSSTTTKPVPTRTPISRVPDTIEPTPLVDSEPVVEPEPAIELITPPALIVGTPRAPPRSTSLPLLRGPPIRPLRARLLCDHEEHTRRRSMLPQRSDQPSGSGPSPYQGASSQTATPGPAQ